MLLIQSLILTGVPHWSDAGATVVVVVIEGDSPPPPPLQLASMSAVSTAALDSARFLKVMC